MLLEAAEGPELLHTSDLISGAPLGSVLGILGIDTFKDMLLLDAGAVMVVNFPIQPLGSSAEHQLQTSSSFLGPQAGPQDRPGPSEDSFVSPDVCPFPWPCRDSRVCCAGCTGLNGSWSHLLCFPQRLAMSRQDASCRAEFGSLRLPCIQSVFMCMCVYIRVCTYNMCLQNIVW